MTSPARRRQMVEEVKSTFPLSERRVYWAIVQPRSSQRYVAHIPDRDKPLIQAVVKLAEKYGR